MWRTRLWATTKLPMRSGLNRRGWGLALAALVLPCIIGLRDHVRAGGGEDLSAAGQDGRRGRAGRKIQIDCRGTGGPTVVVQSGGDMLGALGWTPVMEKVSKNARACAYSRAGILSERSGQGRVRAGGSGARSSRSARGRGRKPALRARRPSARRTLQHDLRRHVQARDRRDGVRGFIPTPTRRRSSRRQACRAGTM